MPSKVLTVSQSTHDGHSAWSSRGAASATNFTTTLQAQLGCHFADTSVFTRFYIFRFGDGSPGSGIPQGATIDTAKLEIRFNNGAAAGSLHNHTYICVENNLDPAGTGAIVNGQLGTQPWQRLGRQSAATTLFGARCGPTHTGNLASEGYGVRDSQALVYHAFQDAREIPASSWSQTDDFAGALQALVNDPGWNGDSQYVMIHMFSDHRISAGSTGGVGYLGGVTWASGQSGTVGEGNGPAAQTYFYDQGPGTYPTKLLVDYTVSTLRSVGGSAQSSGNIRLSPARCLGRMHGVRAEITNGGAMIPGLASGSGDLPFTGMYGFNPLNGLWGTTGEPPGPRVKWSGRRPGRVDGTSIFLEDYAGQAPKIWWDITAYQDDYTTRDIYSMRFYHRYERDAIVNINNHVASFKLAGNRQFWIEHKQYVVVYPSDTFMELRVAWSGGQTAWTTYQFRPPGGNGYYRYEIQVDASKTPKVRVRIYLNDNTTPLETIEANPPNVEIDEVLLGDYNTDAIFFNQRIADVEIWSDYLLNRQYPDSLTNTVGTPFVPQTWSWFGYDGNEIFALDDLGTIDSVDPDGTNVVMTTPTNALTYEDYEARMWPGDDAAYTKYDMFYGTGGRRTLDLYIPNGTPPAGGWPVIVYNHGGFWTSGSKATISEQFVTNACMRGYAVASCSYVLLALHLAGLGAYPAWNPSSATGRYPSMIINFKEAAHYLKTKASAASGGDGTYAIDANKMIACGHSAGGYNALAAAVSRDLTNDGGGRNLTLAGNTGTFGSPNVSDPEFIGAYCLAGPVNLNYLKSWDRSHPDWPLLNTGVGNIHATARLFRGEAMDTGVGNVDYCGVDDMILANAAKVPSICYVWGTADYLVVSKRITPYSQEARLSEVMASVAGSLPPTTSYESHEVPDALHHTIQDVDMDFQHFFRWLRKLPGMYD